jgi:hypothetical protein
MKLENTLLRTVKLPSTAAGKYSFPNIEAILDRMMFNGFEVSS